jgi:hypothetical protein
MLKKKLTLIIMCSLFFSVQGTFAQSKKKEKADKNAITAVDSKTADAKKEPKPYKKIDSTAVTQKGLIDVHQIDNKYLLKFRFPLGSEMMTITRYSKTPAGGGIFGGERNQ